MTTDLDQLVDTHTRLTTELAAQLRDLAQTRSALITAQAHAWLESADFPVTERREAIRHGSAHFTTEIEVQLGEIEALRAEIANVELRVQHSRYLAYRDQG